MYYDKQIELINIINKSIKSDEEYDNKLDEIYDTMQSLRDIAFHVESEYVMPGANEEVDLLQEFDKARKAMKYMNDLCDEYQQRRIYPDPYSISNKDIYIMSHQYDKDITACAEI